MYPLFESIRVENGIAMNLEFHQARMAQNSHLSLHSYIQDIPLPSSGIHKLRISYIRERFTEFTITPYSPTRIKTLKLVYDDTIDYSVKSENRSSLSKLFALRDNCDDIIIIKNGKVTDTSFCNLLFFDGNRWFTPASPLLEGTCRSRLLKNGTITALNITVEDLKKFQYFMLINALLDFNPNRAERLSF